ncbi:MAG TPA: hypothetical protein VGT40_15940 [Methylomirabilota bacterium]|jgi:hypothetical protein|nr:hypothetical protein [Methylomirabilota bacterium]
MRELDLDVLDNIARFHREHERFYTMTQMAAAADLSREANKLKIVADVWLEDRSPAAEAQVDFSDPRYQAAGCTDLNALRAIAAIGVLFMEGQGEPAEIRGLKAKLRGMGVAMQASGQWLAEKMDAAWERESVLFTAELVDAAWPRFQTIVTNWRGSRSTMLAGKLMLLAVECLERIDFTPAAIRADRQRGGRYLRTAGWILDKAAQVLATSGADLADNDIHWTDYREILKRTATTTTR